MIYILKLTQHSFLIEPFPFHPIPNLLIISNTIIKYNPSNPPKMKQQSQLYFQSQEYITPIIDYIPSEGEQLNGERWRLKDKLDVSRQKLTHLSYNSYQPTSSIHIPSKNYRVNTDTLPNQFDKKTTSIMQGYSVNTIPSNQLSINTVKEKLRNYLTNYQIQKEENSISNLQFYSNQNSNYLMGNERIQRVRSRSIKQQNIHAIKQRSKLLKTIDKSLQIDRQRSANEKYQLKQCKREKKELLNQILDKLQTNIKYKKQVELVKSNCKQTEVSIVKQSNFNKKSKKWVQAKNALKQALNTSEISMFSTKNIEHALIRNVESQLKTINFQQPFENHRPITFTPTEPDYQMKKESSVNIFNLPTKDPSSKRDDQIFTFNDIQNANIHRHIKNVSIAISQNSSKEHIQELIADCVLCKVIGKRCSFH